MANQQLKKHKHRYAAPIGGIFLILSIIGIITVIVFSIRLTARVMDNASSKEEFASIIEPVAMFDPSPFESPSDIDEASLLRYAMWAALKGENRDSYTYDDYSELIVPASDLDVAVGRLFGPDITLTHQSFGDYEVQYVYDAEKGIYHVPIAAQLLVYEPVVTDISRNGDYYSLTVGYIPPRTAWSDEDEPEKYMIYVMKKTHDGYFIAKVQNLPSEENSTLDGHVNNQAQEESKSPVSSESVESSKAAEESTTTEQPAEEAAEPTEEAATTEE